MIYVKKLKKEQKKLELKLISLNEFFNSKEFYNLEPNHQDLISIQICNMEAYNKCLIKRLTMIDLGFYKNGIKK